MGSYLKNIFVKIFYVHPMLNFEHDMRSENTEISDIFCNS